MNSMRVSIVKLNRKSARWRNYSYTSAASYFVTISTKHRYATLGHYTTNSVELSTLGKVAEECLLALQEHHPNITRVLFSIQPNHIHILIVLRYLPETRSEYECFGRPVKNSIPTIVRTLKAAITREARRRLSSPRLVVFQRGYHMRVLLSLDYLRRVERYVMNNTRIHIQRRKRKHRKR